MSTRTYRPSRSTRRWSPALVAVLAFASCGSDDESGGQQSTVAAAPAASSTSTATAPSDTAASATTTTTESGETVTLRIGTDDEPGVPSADQILQFADEVATRSQGRLTIEPVWKAAGNDKPDWDQAVARMVVSGEIEMGLIPARAWDTEGVESFRALHAPFLIASDSLLADVVTDSVADDVLAGLGEIGLTGLALAPEGMRHVFSFGEPLLAVSDFEGITLRAPTSATTFAVFEALGAEPDDLEGPDDPFGKGVEAGTVAAAESSFLLAGGLPADSTATGNLTLFPKVNTLVIHTEAYEALSAEQRAILAESALAMRDTAIDVLASDAELAQRFCQFGGRVAVATEAQLEEIRTAVQPVVDQLQVDPATAALIERIQQLSQDATTPEPVQACEPSTSTPGLPVPEPVAGGVAVTVVVNTQIGAATSPVVSATGPFEPCSSVQDLDAAITELGPDVDLFSGQKLVTCEDSQVTIQYDVTMNAASPGITSGTWSIVSSTLAGAVAGNGQLTGRNDGCETLANNELCVLDTFVGTVRG